MSAAAPQAHAHTPPRRRAEPAALLGLRGPGRPTPGSPIAVHDALLAGLPASALLHAVEHVAALRDRATFERIMAMSLRTFQRLKETPGRTLDPEASGRLWRFAETLARATEVLGSRAEAERWLAEPAMALEQRRPLDLMATPTGARLVEDLLERMEYGVYA